MEEQYEGNLSQARSKNEEMSRMIEEALEEKEDLLNQISEADKTIQ